MSGVTMPAYPDAPPPAPLKRKPRWWLVALTVAWVVALAVAAVWSIRHDPPSVADQRSVKQALPYLERAAAALVDAADGDGRAVVLGDLRFSTGCRITPVRSGVQAIRDVTLHLRADQVGSAFDAIADGLPDPFHARVAHSPTGSRHDLYADAGGFVAIDGTARATDTVVTLRASTGCRPRADDVDPHPADPPASNTPGAYGDVVLRLGVGVAGSTVRSVGCANGGIASTIVSAAFPEPADLGRILLATVPSADVVQADPHDWAYRAAGLSIVVSGDAGTARVFATSACTS
ncbi:MAG: hypothetical protein QOH97_1417 [Actinoplanes sp.]|jgi:hypothetical protein|nr:hypothetical protein [Actinoplanes sp.]